jgi:hypothetical protein
MIMESKRLLDTNNISPSKRLLKEYLKYHEEEEKVESSGILNEVENL